MKTRPFWRSRTNPSTDPGNASSTKPVVRIGLNKSTYTYTGKTIKPSFTVNANFKTLKEGADYSVKYSNTPKAVGYYSMTVTGKGSYRGTATAYFKIVPKGTSAKTLKAVSNSKGSGFMLKWKSQKSQVTGYWIRWSTSSSFSGSVKSKKYKLSSSVGKKCTLYARTPSSWRGKKMYAQVCTYRIVNGKTYASSWSKAKSVTLKK